MKRLLLERDFSEEGLNCNDLTFFGELIRSDAEFATLDEAKKIELTRFSSRCILLTETLGARLEAYGEENSIYFDITAERVEFTKDILDLLDQLCSTATVCAEPSTNTLKLRIFQ